MLVPLHGRRCTGFAGLSVARADHRPPSLRWRTSKCLACAAVGRAMAKRVAVIGGGPAGLAACRLLKRFGHQPTVFESGSEVGGIWAPEPTNAVVYRGLVTNIPSVCMQSHDLDFPEGLTSYVSGRELGDYMISYAEHFNLKRFIRFNSKVSDIRFQAEDGRDGHGQWSVSWISDSTRSEVFDAVCVASGHYEFPYCPEIPGMAECISGPRKTRVMHAVEYDDPEEFRDLSVLVVGGRSSGVDIARELRTRAKSLYVLDGCKEVVTTGHCSNVPVGTKLETNGALYFEQQIVPGEPVDVVILATGYTYAFPFLDEEGVGLEFGEVRRYVAPLYQHVLHAHHPSLSFVGIPLAVPCPLALFEAQSYFLASHLRNEWTSAAERQAWVDERLSTLARTQDLHMLGGTTWDYMRELVREAGMPEEEFLTYDKRLRLVQAVYADRVNRKPAMPWDDDEYRRCEYKLDYNRGCFWVTCPDGSVEEGRAV